MVCCPSLVKIVGGFVSWFSCCLFGWASWLVGSVFIVVFLCLISLLKFKFCIYEVLK